MVAATLLALGAAGLHAAWNLILKVSDDRDTAFWAQWLAGAALSLPLLVVVGLPDRAAWPFLAASAVLQLLYVTGLARAYHHGDFSLAYPLARGTGALGAALAGAAFLDDRLHPLSWAGVGLVAAGLVLLVGRRSSAASLAWAVATGLVIASYSVVDAAASRRAGSGLAYGLALQVASAAAISVAGLARGRRAALVALLHRSLGRYLVAGALVTASYTMVVVAFRHAPVGYVSILRESSVVVGAILGWVVLRERMGHRRVLCSVVVAAGLAVLVAGA